MEKNVGFDRNIRLGWLDAVATLATETEDPREIRTRLDAMLHDEIVGPVSRSKTISVLTGIWIRGDARVPELRAEAVAQFPAASPSDRVWLHYGLTLLAYPFFRDAVAAIGQLERRQDGVAPAAVRQRLAAGRGQLGTLLNAVARVFFSLRNWGLLDAVPGKRFAYRSIRPPLGTADTDLEAWLLACALCAHPAGEVPFSDLVGLPELGPFRVSLGVDHLRRSPRFEVQRQGSGWDMVGVVR